MYSHVLSALWLLGIVFEGLLVGDFCWSLKFRWYNFSLQSDGIAGAHVTWASQGFYLCAQSLRPPPFLPHEGGVYSVARVNLTSPGHPHRGALLCTFRFGKRTGTVRLSHCPEGVVLEQSYRFRRRWCSDCCHQDTARMFVDHQVNTWTWKTMLLGIGPQKALELHHKRKKLQVSWHTFAGVCFSQLVFFVVPNCFTKSAKFLIPRNLRRKTRFLWRAGMHDT